MSQINIKENDAIIAANAVEYVEHAIRINDVSRMLLRLESRDADWLAGKISLGLSLQAVELAGKAMLRALGYSVEDIRKRHGKHDILTLLRQVENELQGRSEVTLSRYHHFLTRAPEIDGMQFETTIGEYLSNHFSKGPFARPRSYFYPEFSSFTGPVPIHAFWVMVEDIIAVSQEVISILGAQGET